MNINKAKQRITAFALALAVLLGGMIRQSPMTLQVQAADATASGMQAGTWTGMGRRYIELGRDNNGDPILWRVLEVTISDSDNPGNKTALLLAEDFVDTIPFDSGNNGNWVTSEIKTWLNGDFYTTAFDADEKLAIVTSHYKLGGGYSHSGYNYDTDDNSHVFLLSVEDVRNPAYFDGAGDDGANTDRSAGYNWWLRSPGSNGYNAAVVYSFGSVGASGGPGGNDNGIRPALKVNLSSGIFTSSQTLYSAEFTVQDGQGSGIAGARVSLSGASAPDEIFLTGNNGRCYSDRIPAGEYGLTVTKTGYPAHTGTITIGENSIQHTVTLSEASVPAIVQFGRYSGSAINWRVLDIAGGSALLLCEDGLKSDTWANVDAWINNSGTGGLPEQFSPWELAAMGDYTGDPGKMFLLSKEEVEQYLPANGLRIFSNRLTTYWWLRDDDGSYPYTVYYNGEIAIRNQNNSYDARLAVWLDLSKLSQAVDGGVTTFVPAFPATITVLDSGNNPVEEASLTLTYIGNGAVRGGDGSDILTGVTGSGGTAAFNLPQGTYDIAVTGVSGYSGSGTLTVNSNSGAETITLSPNTAPTPKPNLTRTMGKNDSVSFDADDIAEDTDPGDTLTITGIVTQPDNSIATASLAGGTVTVTAVDYGSTGVEVTVTDGGTPISVTVPIEVTDAPSVSVSSLTITVGDTADFTVNLGDGANAADSATITSGNPAVATATPTQLTLGQSGTVTVEGVSAGQTIISIGYSGGSRNNDADTVRVTVSGQPVAQVQVDFDTQGGEPQPSPITVTVGGQYPALPTVSIEGYTFDGWYTASGSHVREGDPVTIGADHTLHARWIGTTPTPPPVEPPVDPPPTTPSGGSTRSSGRSSGGGSYTAPAKTTLPASAFSWDGGRTLTINHDSITTLGLLSVRWNDITLTRGADFTAHQGSVIIRFSQDFIDSQTPGNHTVRVEFLNHTGETTVTVGDTGAAGMEVGDNLFDNDTQNSSTGGDSHNPNTGDGSPFGVWAALLLGSLSAGALVIFGRKAPRREN